MKYVSLLAVLFLLIGCSLGGKKEISIYSYRPEFTNALNLISEDFKKTHKNVDIKIIEQRNDAINIARANFESGAAADIVMLPSYRVLREMAAEDRIVDLSKSSFTKNVPVGFFKGISYDDKVYGLPLNVNAFAVIYNKEIFEQNNIGIPDTSDSLKNVCGALTAKGITPFAPCIKDYWPLGFIFAMGHSSIINGHEDEWISALDSGIGSFRNENIVNISNFFDLYAANSGEKYLDSTYQSQLDAFAESKSAMIIQNIQTFSMLKNNKKMLRLGIFPIPFTNNKSETRLFADVDTVLTINASIDKSKQKIATKFLEYIAGGISQKVFMAETGSVSPFKNIETDELNGYYENILSYINNDNTIPWLYNEWPVSVFESSKRLMSEYLNNKISFDQALNALDDLWRKKTNKDN